MAGPLRGLALDRLARFIVTDIGPGAACDTSGALGPRNGLPSSQHRVGQKGSHIPPIRSLSGMGGLQRQELQKPQPDSIRSDDVIRLRVVEWRLGWTKIRP
jgi:hypothetical protein